MILLNFGHPITADQRARIEELAGGSVARVEDVAVQLDNGTPFEDEIRRLVDEVDPAGELWRQEGLIVNPPSYAPATAVLIAELHGRMGHFATIVRMRPVPDSTPTRYEVAEIINLQAVRERARTQR